MPGGTQEFLVKLKNSRLKEDVLLEAFYDRILETRAEEHTTEIKSLMRNSDPD